MSYHVFFSLSSSFSKNLQVPKGTLERILGRIAYTEKILGLTRTPTYTPEGEPQKPGWAWRNQKRDMLKTAGTEVDHSIPQWWLEHRERDARIAKMGEAVRGHNRDVERFYADLSRWDKIEKWKRRESEVITVAQSVEFWGGLATLELPRELWDREHFTAHMEHLYALLSTGASQGVLLDCAPFKPKQVSALINLFEVELDQWGFDSRFDIPLDENLRPYDFIASSYDGGYDWCSHCGPIHPDDFHARCRICPRAKKSQCELKNEHPAEFENDDE